MKCPYCSYKESKVVDSRPTDEGERIRRRRECLKCGKRFTTYEVVETVPVVVIKKDRSRETFDRNKLLNGLLRACEKRPVSLDTLEKVVDEIQNTLQNSLESEVPSSRIGKYAMDRLKDIDEVAYVRFASVYRQFKDVHSFMEELSQLIKTKDETKIGPGLFFDGRRPHAPHIAHSLSFGKYYFRRHGIYRRPKTHALS